MGYWKGLFLGFGGILAVLSIILIVTTSNSGAGESLFWLETAGELMGVWIVVYSYLYHKRQEKDRLQGYKYECEKCNKKFKTKKEADKHDREFHKK